MVAQKTPILLVHDGRADLDALEAALASEDYELARATSAEDAVDQLDRRELAVVLLDMPEPDSVEIARRMTERAVLRGRRTPIILVSAMDDDRAHALYAAGVVDIVQKPIDRDIVRAKVAVFADLHRSRNAVDDAAGKLEGFVSILGHDLRNPLSAIDMGAAILRQRVPSDDTTTRLLDRLQSSSRRMSRMIEQVLDLTRSRQPGGLPITREEVNLCPTIIAIVERLRTEHPSRELHLNCPHTLTGSWDRQRVEQALSILVGNALSYGDPARPVTVDVRDDGQTVTLAVHNDGRPIPEAAHAELFSPFRRGARDSMAPETAGLGLGLYIAHQIVMAHRGKLDVRSSATTGTTFQIELPRG